MADAPHPGPRRTAPTSRSAEPAAADPSRSSLSERAWEEPAQLERAEPAPGQAPGGAELEDIVESGRRARRSFSRVRVWPPGTPDDSHPSAPPPGGLPRPGGGFDGASPASKAGFDLAGSAEAPRPPDGLAPQPLIHRRAGSAPASAEGSAAPPTPFQPPPPAPPSPPIGARRLSEDQQHEAPHPLEAPPAIQTTPLRGRQSTLPARAQDEFKTGIEHLSSSSIDGLQPLARKATTASLSNCAQPPTLQAKIEARKFNVIGEYHNVAGQRRELEKKVLAKLLGLGSTNDLHYKREWEQEAANGGHADDRTHRINYTIHSAIRDFQRAVDRATDATKKLGFYKRAWDFLDTIEDELQYATYTGNQKTLIRQYVTAALAVLKAKGQSHYLDHTPEAIEQLQKLLTKGKEFLLQDAKSAKDARELHMHNSANAIAEKPTVGAWKIGEVHREGLQARTPKAYALTSAHEFETAYNEKRLELKLPESDGELKKV